MTGSILELQFEVTVRGIRIAAEEPFGYMWECPDAFSLCNGIVYQYPVEEINALRGDEVVLSDGANEVSDSAFDCEIHFKLDAGKKGCLLDKDVKILWEDGIFFITLSKESGCGRGKREILLPELQELRILKDVSMLEIYVNYGEYVYTARYYPKNVVTTNISITNSTDVRLFSMKKVKVISE